MFLNLLETPRNGFMWDQRFNILQMKVSNVLDEYGDETGTFWNLYHRSEKAACIGDLYVCIVG
jgi:hypothetical protein